MSYYLAFDVGTTTMKSILFDDHFNDVVKYSEEYFLITSKESIVTLNPEIYYDVFKKSIFNLRDKGVDFKKIKSITFTTQGETFIPIGRDGNVLNDAIIWLDSRAEKEASYIKKNIILDDFYSKTGLSDIDGTLPAAKILWIYNNNRKLYDETYKFLLLEDYLIYRVTGKIVSEKSLQSSTGWYDIVNDCYYDTILSLCNIDKEKLPDIVSCGQKIGTLCKEAINDTGLDENTVVVSGAMDQIASAIGAGNINEGIVTETTGTALVIAATVDKPDFKLNPKITIYKHYNNKYLYIPFCRTAGIVLKWFKDTMMTELNDVFEKTGKTAYEIIDDYAKKSNVGSNGVVCVPNFSGSDKYENSTGCFLGLTLNTGKEDLSRSVLEGIGYMLKEKIDILTKTGINVSEICSLGGGAYSDIWCEIKASICNLPLVRYSQTQSTALGAAILGAVGVGEFLDVSEALKNINSKKIVTKQNLSHTKQYEELYWKFISIQDILFNN